MNTQEIVAITFRAWCASVDVQDDTKAQIYSNHLGALGYEACIGPEGCILLKEEHPIPLTLSQRYQMAASHLRWHDKGVCHGVQGRMKYLALLLDTLAHHLQQRPLSLTLDWINTQINYEKAHNAYAHRLLTSGKTHLTREQRETSVFLRLASPPKPVEPSGRSV